MYWKNINADISGPMQENSLRARYFLMMKDNYSLEKLIFYQK